MKIRVGILFGGSSREREISFAGGRTVYDNLDKSVFEPVPVFIDSFGNFILINWEYIYKGSIRDFYPPFDAVEPSPNQYQVYAESLGDLGPAEQMKLIHKIGVRVDASSLSGLIDIAFLCLHGTNGEDGRIQGLLEYYGIPYTGSGIVASSIGMNKVLQKQLMQKHGFNTPGYLVIERTAWLSSGNQKQLFENAVARLGSMFMVKAANQGSSIGISVFDNGDFSQFVRFVDKSFFIQKIDKGDWNKLDFNNKVEYVRVLTDIREGLGLPCKIEGKIIYHPEELLSNLNQIFSEPCDQVLVEAVDCEQMVILEQFLSGKEFSCIVIEGLDGVPVSLPPTEIRKGKEMFDYRSKYLPGLSRKITPIDLEFDEIEAIRYQCQKLFSELGFGVYARIDGFYTSSGIFLNDPNTTSGMLPSSFFFHQAAEIGLSPSQFLTFIIQSSLKRRQSDMMNLRRIPSLLQSFEQQFAGSRKAAQRKKIAVILGGYSSERHISVESGRNIFEKLSSSVRFIPIPVFLTGDEKKHTLHLIPVNVLLKDNADDIREKVEHFSRHPVIDKIIHECSAITNYFTDGSGLGAPREITYQELSGLVDGVFIALHGRPGEDGVVQFHLEEVGLPYNGSGTGSSKITIDKYATNEILMQNGVSVARHLIVLEHYWRDDPSAFEDRLLSQFPFPFIAKPVDDGCSSAVKIIRNVAELHAYCDLMFRKTEDLIPAAAAVLKIKPKEEFPCKDRILIEELITAGGAEKFLEVTGGLMTSYNKNGELEYEVFEASEALSEGDVLSLEEKFLAGQGQNITPARYAGSPAENARISEEVKRVLQKTAALLNVEGYARIDAFVRIYKDGSVQVLVIEVNSLPGMTPATCIFHQAAINDHKPYEFIEKLIDFGFERMARRKQQQLSGR